MSSTSWLPGQSGNNEGFSKKKREETAFFREGAREHNGNYLSFWWTVMCDNNADLGYRIKCSQLLAENGNGKAPQALQVELDDKTDKKPRVIEHVGMTQEEVDKAYPHEVKARKERLEREAKEAREAS